MEESSKLLNDLTKVFIPCRTVMEMEALTSLYLVDSVYDRLKDLPESRPSSDMLIDVFGAIENEFYSKIIEYFVNITISKLKPIVMYAREHHDRYRMGNVIPYSKTRVCLFLAIHRLKFKFLMIRKFVEDFKNNNYKLDFFYDDNDLNNKTLISALNKIYYKENKKNLKLMFPKAMTSESVKNLIVDNKESITSKKLLEMASSKNFSEQTNVIKFIMREIKASIFVCKLMFAKIDVLNPFSQGTEIMIDAEEIMISNDYIPELLPAMSSCLRENNTIQLQDLTKAFDFMTNKVLTGINNAIKIASGGQLEPELGELLYITGDRDEILKKEQISEVISSNISETQEKTYLKQPVIVSSGSVQELINKRNATLKTPIINAKPKGKVQELVSRRHTAINNPNKRQKLGVEKIYNQQKYKPTFKPAPITNKLKYVQSPKLNALNEEIIVSKSDGRRICPKCGNYNPAFIREVDDKTHIIMSYPRMYGKKFKCGECGGEWKKG